MMAEQLQNSNSRSFRKKNVSLYWREKTMILLFAAQIHGVVLRAAAFPPQWRIPMSWSLLVNLDILRYTSVLDSGESSVFGFDVNEPFLLRMAWAGAYSLLAITTFILRNWLLSEADRNGISIERFRRTIDGNILFLAAAIHVPACLAFASFFSSFWPASPSAAPAMMLTNPGVIAVVVVFIPPAFMYTIMTPVFLLYAASKHSIHVDPKKHEYALQTTEIEYALRLSDVWLHEHVWVISSFSRSILHSYDAGLWSFFSGACAWIAAGASIAPGPQADAIFAVLALWSFRHTFSPTYRCRSSNILFTSVIIPLVVTSFFGLLRAHEISNELTVDRRLTQILMFVNIAGAAAALLSLSVSFFFGRGWPLVIGTSEKLHNSSAFEEIYEGISLLFGPLIKKQVMINKISHEDQEVDPSLMLSSSSSMSASLGATLGATSDTNLILSSAFERLIQKEKQRARTFIEMRDVDPPKLANKHDQKRSSVNDDDKEVDDSLLSQQQTSHDIDIVKVEAEIVACLRVLQTELSIQRSRPQLLVDVNKLQAAVSALQRPFGNALFLKLTLANACTDAISEGCVEIETAKQSGSIANHPLFSTEPPVLPWLRLRMEKRSSEFVLLTKVKMSILLKLLAIRTFIGERKLTPLYIKGVNESLFLQGSKTLLE